MRRLFSLLLLASAVRAGESLQLFESVEPHMGTLVRIKLYAANGQQAEAAFRSAVDRIKQLDEILSDYKPDSELSRLSGAAAGHPVRISDDLFRVLWASQTLAEESDGAFDVTLGPVIRLWREARKQHRPPDAAALRAASGLCGYRKLHLDEATRSVTLDQPGMQLDVGGIAKGYAADAALAALGRVGIRSGLVAVSGDLAFSDAPPGERGWKIGVGPDDQSYLLELSNTAVSTFGDDEQHLDAGGKRYSHIIDPKTDLGLTDGIVVTVVAPRGMVADGMATAVSVRGAVLGMEMVEKQPGVAAIIVVRAGERVRVAESSGFGNLSRKR